MAEIELAQRKALEAGADAAVPANHWAEGGKGAVDLAQAVIAACDKPTDNGFRPLYELDQPLKTKIETIAKEMYGAADVEYSERATSQLELLSNQGYSQLPICVSSISISESREVCVVD